MERGSLGQRLLSTAGGEIYYVYQDPILAWKFTQAREALEGRFVPKKIFVDDFFKAKENVNAVKKKYGQEIGLNIAVKNFENKLDKLFLNVENVDSYIKIHFTLKSLIQLL